MSSCEAERTGSRWEVVGHGMAWCCPTCEPYGNFWGCSTSVGAMGFPALQIPRLWVPWHWECPWLPTDPSSWWVLWGAVGLSLVYGVCRALRDQWILWGSVGLYEVLWDSVGLCGVLWVTMGSMGSTESNGFYAALCVSMGHRGSVWGAVGLYGVLWISLRLCGLLWGLYGVLWITMDLYGALRGAVDHYGSLWGAMGCRGSLWISMGRHGVPWITMDLYGAPWGAGLWSDSAADVRGECGGAGILLPPLLRPLPNNHPTRYGAPGGQQWCRGALWGEDPAPLSVGPVGTGRGTEVPVSSLGSVGRTWVEKTQCHC